MALSAAPSSELEGQETKEKILEDMLLPSTQLNVLVKQRRLRFYGHIARRCSRECKVTEGIVPKPRRLIGINGGPPSSPQPNRVKWTKKKKKNKMRSSHLLLTVSSEKVSQLFLV